MIRTDDNGVSIRNANGVHLSVIWGNQHSCVPLDEFIFSKTCGAVYTNIAREMNNVCIFSHDQVAHDITVIHCSSNYSRVVRYYMHTASLGRRDRLIPAQVNTSSPSL